MSKLKENYDYICIGAGPGDIGYLTQRGAELIKNADLVAGFDAVFNVVHTIIPATTEVVLMNYRDQVEQLDKVVAAHHAGKHCVGVFIGDIHFSGFQYLEHIERACGHPVETLPGISSVKYSPPAPKSAVTKPPSLHSTVAATLPPSNTVW